MHRLTCVIAALVLIAADAGAQSAARVVYNPLPTERVAALDASKVTFDDALSKSLDHVVNGLPYRIELTTRESKPVYDIIMLVGDPSHHMTLSAADGTLIEQYDTSFNKHGTVLRIRLAEPNIGLVQAMQLAEATFPTYRAYSSEAVVKGQDVTFEVRMTDKVNTKHVTFSLAGDMLSQGPPPLRTEK